MKKPKTRQIIYVILRTHPSCSSMVMDSYASLEEAEFRAGQYEQQMFDAGHEDFNFVTQSCAFYDM